ncbi:hypothetical protein HPB50_007820 [Hyalomma asiaticum]|uniref:Uncharacterized protein n=1 Tax=Hyalomma asiaticum TaxID=266040 RepID=A0ACB7T418_HYAAI|nr:hypothetical protein HPB50_007820 [Hyalomma asiaticum]
MIEWCPTSVVSLRAGALAEIRHSVRPSIRFVTYFATIKGTLQCLRTSPIAILVNKLAGSILRAPPSPLDSAIVCSGPHPRHSVPQQRTTPEPRRVAGRLQTCPVTRSTALGRATRAHGAVCSDVALGATARAQGPRRLGRTRHVFLPWPYDAQKVHKGTCRSSVARTIVHPIVSLGLAMIRRNAAGSTSATCVLAPGRSLRDTLTLHVSRVTSRMAPATRLMLLLSSLMTSHAGASVRLVCVRKATYALVRRSRQRPALTAGPSGTSWPRARASCRCPQAQDSSVGQPAGSSNVRGGRRPGHRTVAGHALNGRPNRD